MNLSSLLYFTTRTSAKSLLFNDMSFEKLNSIKVYFNNPTACAPMKVDLNCVERNEQIYNVIQEIVPNFLQEFKTESSSPSLNSHIDGDEIDKPVSTSFDNIIVKPLLGGLSNHLFLVTNKQSTQNKQKTILIRIHPDNDCNDDDNNKKDKDGETITTTQSSEFSKNKAQSICIVDHNMETKVLAWLASLSLAPKFYGRFLNGRVEEFYEGQRELKFSELSEPKFARAVAEAMARLHRLEVPDGIFDCHNEGGEGRKRMSEDGDIWDRNDSWLKMAQESISSCGNDNGGNTSKMLAGIVEEWNWLKTELLSKRPLTDGNANASNDDVSIEEFALKFCRNVVFTHGDLQCLNILTPCHFEEDETDTSTDKADIRLIDFEYARLNRRVIDIANTFCEYCDMTNLNADYEKDYPSEEKQNLFLKAYVDGLCDNNFEKKLNVLCNDDDSTTIWKDFLSVVRLEVDKHALVSHLGWACWALAEASINSIEFDYLAYARLRMEGYEFMKRKIYGMNTEKDKRKRQTR